MKYFTKEWYALMQKIHLDQHFEADPRAEHYSQAYYRELYRNAKKERLEWLSRVMHDSMDINKESRAFDSTCRCLKKRYMEQLPHEIVAMVADVRVLALGRCSASVKDSIDRYAKECKTVWQQALDAYDNVTKQQFHEEMPAWLSRFSFHDSQVLSMRRAKQDYVLTFRPEAASTDVKEIVFCKASIIKSGKPLHNAWWLYEEIYKTETGYEIHILFDKTELCEWIIHCEDVIVQ